MINNVRKELEKYKNKEVNLLINEGRSKKRKETGIIKELYNNIFIIEIDNINTSFSYSDIITKTIIIENNKKNID